MKQQEIIFKKPKFTCVGCGSLVDKWKKGMLCENCAGKSGIVDKLVLRCFSCNSIMKKPCQNGMICKKCFSGNTICVCGHPRKTHSYRSSKTCFKCKCMRFLQKEEVGLKGFL